ncbi:MAG: pyridoxamine 5'-phosphate oxidase [Alphaproteobacteria bacterium]|nr:pyridoxamine 5'-phosphate oxidase [Alphaproteobacteria bacterium]
MLDEGTAQLETSDPLVQFDTWYREAWASERDANAMACATADADGVPSVRMVLLKGREADGFVFYTNFGSRKGHEIGANPRASLVFHWKSLKRQVRIDGTVETVDDAAADAYFASRPRDSQVAAWASLQSEVLHERFELEKRLAHFELKFKGGPVPRPPHWSGYLVRAEKLEFWLDRPYRLHERIVFQRASREWHVTRLYP